MRRFIVMLLLAVSLTAVAAKPNNFILRAVVNRTDSSGRVPLDSVAIMISAVGDTAAVKFQLLAGNREELMTDKGGEIRALIDGKPGKYMLTLDREGYEPLVKEFERKYRDQTTVWMGSIIMKPVKIKQLDEVQVTATAIKMVMKGDTIVYNADAFNLAEGSMLDALVKQLPNATLNAEGEITVNGRKINSLLINGKDFFSGDMDVALKNLPSYTVKNIQVYDKAADDDYLSQASQKLDRKEDDENLVMDVVLKKEYSIGMMASVEAGYGTSNRWIAKGFGLGFTEDVRLSAFANCNNVRDFATAGTRGEWDWSSGGNGDWLIEKGGIDYLYENKEKKIEVKGNAVASHTTNNNISESASTLFYPSGDLYRRQASTGKTVSTEVNTDHQLQISGESVFLTISPNVKWSRSDNSNMMRQATFNAMPAERNRTEALDSVFTHRRSERYNELLLTRLRTASGSLSENIDARVQVDARLRFKSTPGGFLIGGAGSYNSRKITSDNIYGQSFGGANQSVESKAVNNDRFSTDNPETTKFSAWARYGRDWSRLNDRRSNTVNLWLNTAYHYTRVAKDYNLFASELDSLQATTALPSMTRPEHAVADMLNSYNSLNNDHNIQTDLSFRYFNSPTAETDSGLNPSIGMGAEISHKYRSNALDYNTPEPSHESVLRRTNSFYPSAWLTFYSSNKLRYMNVYLRYSMNVSEPGLNLFLHNRQSSNPLMIYEYNAHNLRSSQEHRIYANFNRYGRSSDRSFFSVVISYNVTRNAIGNASVYNPLTGVTVFKPMNINGNWNVNSNIRYNNSFGKSQQISFGVYAGAAYGHSVDFQTTIGSPERSLVKNLVISGNVNGGYKFKGGSVVSARFGTRWNNSLGSREDFRRISALSYDASVIGQAKLPWEMELSSDFSVSWKRGYDVAEMNRPQWIWNATLSKSILKGNMTFKLYARDILGQEKSYSIYIDAQGRYETWRNNLGRYVMLSVIYRFNKSPKKKAE